MAKSNVTITFSVTTELTGKKLARAIADEFSINVPMDTPIDAGRGHFVDAKYSKGKVKVEVVK